MAVGGGGEVGILIKSGERGVKNFINYFRLLFSFKICSDGNNIIQGVSYIVWTFHDCGVNFFFKFGSLHE